MLGLGGGFVAGKEPEGALGALVMLFLDLVACENPSHYSL